MELEKLNHYGYYSWRLFIIIRFFITCLEVQPLKNYLDKADLGRQVKKTHPYRIHDVGDTVLYPQPGVVHDALVVVSESCRSGGRQFFLNFGCNFCMDNFYYLHISFDITPLFNYLFLLPKVALVK